MDATEIETLERLKAELSGVVNKNTAKEAQKVYNRYNEDQLTDCMCSRIRRKILGKVIVEWYEGQKA